MMFLYAQFSFARAYTGDEKHELTENHNTMALFVIYGNMNSGKTHTCWLIYALLKNAGKRLAYDTVPQQPDWTFSEVLQHITNMSVAPATTPLASDFRALFAYKGKKIAIFSAGDFLHDPNWEVTSFDDNMAWALQNNVDHVICCSRSLNRTGSVQRYILDNFRISIYRWYWKKQTNVVQDQIEDAQRVAIELFKDIESDC